MICWDRTFVHVSHCGVKSTFTVWMWSRTEGGNQSSLEETAAVAQICHGASLCDRSPPGSAAEPGPETTVIRTAAPTHCRPGKLTTVSSDRESVLPPTGSLRMKKRAAGQLFPTETTAGIKRHPRASWLQLQRRSLENTSHGHKTALTDRSVWRSTLADHGTNPLPD